MKKTLVKWLAAVAALAAVVLVADSMVITHENEYSVIRQFGKVMDVRSTPGVSLRMPLVQTVTKVPDTVLLYDLPLSDVITQDKKTMVADSFVLWRIIDPQLFIQTLNGQVGSAEARLSTIVYNSMKNTISSRTQADVISGRDGELAADIKAGVGDTLAQYGIELIAVETKHLDLPDDNKAAVYQRMISERGNIAASYTAQGESEAKKIRSETDKEIEIMLSEARAQAETLVAQGEAEYMKILANAYNDPGKADFYAFVRSLDAAKTSLSGGNKTLFLTPDSPLAQVFYGE
ncbi:protease modulator HflC [Allofournierella sp.]|uniref:protease modulator HflC n=1 Tax=Allofournierella sp. TaxID=1940256 RepID=UPI003AB3339F